MNPLGSLHRKLVIPRRITRLAAQVAPLVPRAGRVLDVGAGSGALSQAVMLLRPDIEVTALEAKVRPDAVLSEVEYDGHTIPFGDGSFDCVLLVDVVHHASEPRRLLAEARRVASRRVIIKDHLAHGLGARPTLRVMDWVGNAGYGVPLSYTYWPRDVWERMLAEASLEIESWSGRLHLYPQPISLVCDRSLHFLASLRVKGGSPTGRLPPCPQSS